MFSSSSSSAKCQTGVKRFFLFVGDVLFCLLIQITFTGFSQSSLHSVYIVMKLMIWRFLILCLYSLKKITVKVIVIIFLVCFQWAGASSEGNADPPLPLAGDGWVGPEGALPDWEAADPRAVDPWGQGNSSSPQRWQTARGPTPVPGRILEPVSPAADPTPGIRSGCVSCF